MSRGVPRRTAPVTIRLLPEVKELALRLAEHENRSLTNLIETLIRERAARLKIRGEQANTGRDQANGK